MNWRAVLEESPGFVFYRHDDDEVAREREKERNGKKKRKGAHTR